MKKFLLFLAAATACFSASALELTFWLGNQKITPGERVEFNDITVTDEGSYKEVMMDPALYLSTDLYSSKIKVTARCTSGQSIQLCAGGTCRGGEEVIKENVTINTGQKMDLGFDFQTDLDSDEEIPVVITEFEAEDITKPGTKISFVLVMCEQGAYVTEISADENLYITDGGLAFDTPEERLLTVANLSGVTFFTGKVNGKGSVALPAGLYVYTFGNNKGKIYIR